MLSEGLLSYAAKSLEYFPLETFEKFGLVLTLSSFCGAVFLAYRCQRDRKEMEPFWSVTVTTAVAVYIFHGLVPSGLEARYLLPVLPLLILLAVYGITTILQWTCWKGKMYAAVFTLFGALLIAENAGLPEKEVHGYRQIAKEIESASTRAATEILISSDARGEGAFIAEFALLDQRPNHIIHRASKRLARSDWLGRDYALEFDNEKSLRDFLSLSNIGWAIVDKSIQASIRFPHTDLLEQTLGSDPSPFSPATSFRISRDRRGAASEVLLYRRRDIGLPKDE